MSPREQSWSEIEKIQDIPWSNLTIKEAVRCVQKLAHTSETTQQARDYQMLAGWLLRSYHYDRAVENARIAFANAEREMEKDRR